MISNSMCNIHSYRVIFKYIYSMFFNTQISIRFKPEEAVIQTYVFVEAPFFTVNCKTVDFF